MSWSFTQSVNPDGYGFFAVQMWNSGTANYVIDPVTGLPVVDPVTGKPTYEIASFNPANITDVTFFRDVPTIIESMEFSDPFGDATAVLRFPQCTGFDSPANEDTWWLKEYTNVDILWVPCSNGQLDPSERAVIDPMTQARNLYAHVSQAFPVWEGFTISIDPSTEGVTVQCLGALRQLDNYYARPLSPLQPKFVETYIQRYMDPRRHGIWTLPLRIDWPDGWLTWYGEIEKNVYKALGPRFIPSEKVQNQNWTGYVTRNSGSWQPILTGYINDQLSYLYAKPEAVDGNPLLARGDQWTITNTPGRQPVMKVRRSDADPTLVAWYGQPGVDARLTRDGTQAYNVVFGSGAGPTGESAWATRYYPGGPWSVFRPLYAKELTWRGDEAKPYYPTGFPITDLYDGYDAAFERANGIVVREKYVNNMPEGIIYSDAQKIAENWVDRDNDPGWSGQITLQVDLRDMAGDPKSKWLIRDGDVIVLYGFQGTGDTVVKGVNKFHITQVVLSPTKGTVSLQVDTKFRDRLTVEEAIQRGKDTLSPVRSLIVNRASSKIEDTLVPWDNHAGSGMVPKYTRDFDYTDQTFPYLGEAGAKNPAKLVGTRTTGYRPKDIFKPAWRIGGNGKPVQGDDYADAPNADNATAPDEASNFVWLRSTVKDGTNTVTQDKYKPFYVPVHAGSNELRRRWAVVPVLLSQAGTISLTEFCAYDEDGNPAPVEFHVSVYETNSLFISNMPQNQDPEWGRVGEPEALFPNSFERLNPETNLPWPPGAAPSSDYHMPQSPILIGWGTYDRPAGYSPGTKKTATSINQKPTGYLIDGASWPFNFVGKPGGIGDTGTNAKQVTPNGSNVTGMVAIYAKIPDWLEPADKARCEWVYFMGRFYRDIPTT